MNYIYYLLFLYKTVKILSKTYPRITVIRKGITPVPVNEEYAYPNEDGRIGLSEYGEKRKRISKTPACRGKYVITGKAFEASEKYIHQKGVKVELH